MLVSRFCLLGTSYHRINEKSRIREHSVIGFIDYASRMTPSASQSPWWWRDVYVSCIDRYARSFMDRG